MGPRLESLADVTTKLCDPYQPFSCWDEPKLSKDVDEHVAGKRQAMTCQSYKTPLTVKANGVDRVVAGVWR
jgi:hypothetical protein